MTHLATVATFRVGQRVRVKSDQFVFAPRSGYIKGDAGTVIESMPSGKYCLVMFDANERRAATEEVVFADEMEAAR